MKHPGVLLIGLTGGIGSGKTTVATLLAEQGLAVVDADAASRSLTAVGGLAMPQIEAAFGPEMIMTDGSLNRQRMRETVFSQPQERKKLESILHPLVGQALDQEISQHVRSGARCVVLDVPLITPASRWPALLNRILVVDCLEATQIARVGERSQLGADEVKAIIRGQISRLDRLRLADWVIFNDGLSLAELKKEVFGLPLPWPQSGSR
jgi:dephospho-CoA kinase